MKTVAVNIGATVYVEVEDDYDEDDATSMARQRFLEEAHTYSKHDIWAEIVEEID